MANHSEESNNTYKPLTQESFVTKSLRVERNTFPNLREGDRDDWVIWDDENDKGDMEGRRKKSVDGEDK